MELFECPKVPKTMKIKVTELGCGKFYKIANTIPHTAVHKIYGIYAYCRKCSIGKKNAKKHGISPEIKKKQIKICKLYETAPNECILESVFGKFSRRSTHTDSQWKNKIFCDRICSQKYHALKYQGKIK